MRGKAQWLSLFLVFAFGVFVGAVGIAALRPFGNARVSVLEGYAVVVNGRKTAMGFAREPAGVGDSYNIAGAMWRDEGGHGNHGVMPSVLHRTPPGSQSVSVWSPLHPQAQPLVAPSLYGWNVLTNQCALWQSQAKARSTPQLLRKGRCTRKGEFGTHGCCSVSARVGWLRSSGSGHFRVLR